MENSLLIGKTFTTVWKYISRYGKDAIQGHLDQYGLVLEGRVSDEEGGLHDLSVRRETDSVGTRRYDVLINAHSSGEFFDAQVEFYIGEEIPLSEIPGNYGFNVKSTDVGGVQDSIRRVQQDIPDLEVLAVSNVRRSNQRK